MSLTERLDNFQQHHRWAGLPIAVVYKYADDQGSYLAALIAYYGLVSLFPLLLLLTSVLGFALQGNPQLQQQILHSALREFPGIGTQLASPAGLHGSATAIVVGILGALYGSLGVAQAVQNAMNVAWAVPRHQRPNPIKARLRSLALLGTAGIGVLGATILSGLTTSTGINMGAASSVLATAASVVLNAAVFLFAFRISTAHRLGLRDAAPGAVTAAVLWQLLQTFGTAYVTHVVRRADVANGTFAFVLGLVAWLYLAAVALVLSVEINVVRAKKLYPRALLTPFTDNVDLTSGDRRTYADAAVAQRSKGFEKVDVTFDREGQDGGQA